MIDKMVQLKLGVWVNEWDEHEDIFAELSEESNGVWIFREDKYGDRTDKFFLDFTKMQAMYELTAYLEVGKFKDFDAQNKN